MLPEKYLYSLVTIVALLSAACSKSDSEPHFIRTDLAEVTFRDSEPISVSVESYPADWVVLPLNVDWLNANKHDNSLVLTVLEDNLSSTDRSTVVSLSAGNASTNVVVYQLPADYDHDRYVSIPQFESAAISPSGKFFGGYYATTQDNIFFSHVVAHNISSGQEIVWNNIPESDMLPTSIACVSDDGKVFVVDGMHGGIKIFDVNSPDSFTIANAGDYNPTTLFISQVTIDNQSWVGYAGGQNTMFVPIQFLNGTLSELPMPELNFRGNPHETGIMARGVSVDGEIVYGTVWDDNDFGMVYWDSHRNPYYVGERVFKPIKVKDPTSGEIFDYNLVDGMISWSGQYQVSHHGKYLAGTWRTEDLDDDNNTIISHYYPAFFNTQSGELSIFSEYGDASGMFVTDDGIGFIGSPHIMTSETFIVDINSRTSVGTLRDWVSENYNLYMSNGFLFYITYETNILWGATLTNDSSGILSAPVWYILP